MSETGVVDEGRAITEPGTSLDWPGSTSAPYTAPPPVGADDPGPEWAVLVAVDDAARVDRGISVVETDGTPNAVASSSVVMSSHTPPPSRRRTMGRR